MGGVWNGWSLEWVESGMGGLRPTVPVGKAATEPLGPLLLLMLVGMFGMRTMAPTVCSSTLGTLRKGLPSCWLLGQTGVLGGGGMNL